MMDNTDVDIATNSLLKLSKESGGALLNMNGFRADDDEHPLFVIFAWCSDKTESKEHAQEILREVTALCERLSKDD